MEHKQKHDMTGLQAADNIYPPNLTLARYIDSPMLDKGSTLYNNCCMHRYTTYRAPSLVPLVKGNAVGRGIPIPTPISAYHFAIGKISYPDRDIS